MTQDTREEQEKNKTAKIKDNGKCKPLWLLPEHKIEWNDFTPIQTKKIDIFSGKKCW